MATHALTTAPARRDFLRWASRAMIGAAVPVVPLVAHASSPLCEDADLLALGQRVDEVDRAYLSAQSRVDKAHAVFEERRPPHPPEMLETELDREWGVTSEMPRDMEDRPVRYTGGRPVRLIAGWSARYSLGEIDGRFRVARQLRMRLPAIDAHEDAIEALRREIGGDTAAADRDQAARDLGDLVTAIFRIPACTIVGVGIKGHALIAHGHTGPKGQAWSSHMYGNSLAAEVVRLTGGQVGTISEGR